MVEMPEQVLSTPTIAAFSRDAHHWLRALNPDFLVILAGVLIYLVLGYWFHPLVIGVPVFSR